MHERDAHSAAAGSRRALQASLDFIEIELRPIFALHKDGRGLVMHKPQRLQVISRHVDASRSASFRSCFQLTGSPKIVGARNARVADLSTGITAGWRRPWPDANDSAAVAAVERVDSICRALPSPPGGVIVEQEIELAFLCAGKIVKRDANLNHSRAARRCGVGGRPTIFRAQKERPGRRARPEASASGSNGHPASCRATAPGGQRSSHPAASVAQLSRQAAATRAAPGRVGDSQVAARGRAHTCHGPMAAPARRSRAAHTKVARR